MFYSKSQFELTYYRLNDYKLNEPWWKSTCSSDSPPIK